MRTFLLLTLVPLLLCLHHPALGVAVVKQFMLRQNPELKDKVSHSWLLSETRMTYTGSVAECALECTAHANCVTVMVNKGDNRCRLHGARISNRSALASGPYFLSYDVMGRAEGFFGDECMTDGDCSLANAQCVDGLCLCQSGYSFSSHEGICGNGCKEYGNEFTAFKNVSSTGQNVLTLTDHNDVTPSGCAEACVNATAFVCLSFEITSSPHKCLLFNVTSLQTASAEFANDDWRNVTYFQRHCA